MVCTNRIIKLWVLALFTLLDMSPALGNLSFMETFLEYSKLSNPGSIGILPSELYMVWMSSGLNSITIFPFPIPGTFNLQTSTVCFSLLFLSQGKTKLCYLLS